MKESENRIARPYCRGFFNWISDCQSEVKTARMPLRFCYWEEEKIFCERFLIFSLLFFVSASWNFCPSPVGHLSQARGTFVPRGWDKIWLRENIFLLRCNAERMRVCDFSETSAFSGWELGEKRKTLRCGLFFGLRMGWRFALSNIWTLLEL